MEVDVIIKLVNGSIEDVQVVQSEGTAEATFDSMCEEIFGTEEYEELVEDARTYDERYENVLEELEHTGTEIYWASRIKVNKFK